jgi:pimeloyl-ACP methyl ester carboxylesterase
MHKFLLALGLLTMPAMTVAEEIEIAGLQGQLKGTLLVPSDVPRPPTAVIIPGSGPTDRDGNNPLGVRASTYRLMAEALADKGIATLRIDKRGMFGSAAAVADANAVSLQDYAADTRLWAEAVRVRTGSDCVWLIGHSEGGLVALQAAQSLPNLCGLVLVATAGRPLGQVIKDQLAANPANAFLLSQANAAIDKLSAGERVDVTGMHPALVPLFNPAVQDFLISVLSVDPAELAAKAGVPILVLQGEADLQVSVEDARRLHGAAPGSKLVLLPAVSHVMKRVEGEGRAANLATYGNPDLGLAEGVVPAIAAFMSDPETKAQR